MLSVTLVASCKKKKNEELFVGTYSGVWREKNTYAEFTDTSVFQVTEDTTYSGTFEISRVGNFAIINNFTDIRLTELEYYKEFKYHSPTNGLGISASGNYSYWKLILYPDSLIWEEGYRTAGYPEIIPERLIYFNGTKQD